MRHKYLIIPLLCIFLLIGSCKGSTSSLGGGGCSAIKDKFSSGGISDEEIDNIDTDAAMKEAEDLMNNAGDGTETTGADTTNQLGNIPKGLDLNDIAGVTGCQIVDVMGGESGIPYGELAEGIDITNEIKTEADKRGYTDSAIESQYGIELYGDYSPEELKNLQLALVAAERGVEAGEGIDPYNIKEIHYVSAEEFNQKNLDLASSNTYYTDGLLVTGTNAGSAIIYVRKGTLSNPKTLAKEVYHLVSLNSITPTQGFYPPPPTYAEREAQWEAEARSEAARKGITYEAYMAQELDKNYEFSSGKNQDTKQYQMYLDYSNTAQN